jgi:hypothetical protein
VRTRRKLTAGRPADPETLGLSPEASPGQRAPHRRAGTRSGELIDEQTVIAERDPIARAELAAPHAEPVHRGAVLGVKVSEDPATLAEHEPGVVARHGEIGDDDIARVVAADEELRRLA